MHIKLTKCNQVSRFTCKISGKIWYSTSPSNHMALCLYVYQMVDTHISKCGYKSHVILIFENISPTCLLVKTPMVGSIQYFQCIHFIGRSYCRPHSVSIKINGAALQHRDCVNDHKQLSETIIIVG